MDLKRDRVRFKVTLKDVKPVVWRRIEVPATYTFWDLHVAIQDAMGWSDYHLHAFRARNALGKLDEIGIPDDDAFEGEPLLPGWKVRVADYFNQGGPIDPGAFDPTSVRFDNPAARWKEAFADG